MQRRRWGGDGWQHTRQTLEKSPPSKLYTTWVHILSDRNVFAPQGEVENGGVQCPWGFSCFFFLGGHLPQTSTRSIQYLPVIFVRLAVIRKDFHGSWCGKLLAI